MYKLITLLIFVALNLSLYSQVVIKDEIILQESDNTDEEQLHMPFYGKVTGAVNWGGIWWGWLKKVVIEAGGQIESRSCPNPCDACYISNSGWAIYDLPALTEVTVKVYSHCVNGELVEAETRLINTGQDAYNIEYYNPNQQQWFLATTIKFTATPPPGSGNCEQFECEEENFLPSINMTQQPAGYEGIVCKDNCEDWAIFQVPLGDDGYLYNINDVCFNKQLQGWWFNLDDNHSFTINYVMEFCSTNVICALHEILEDYTQFPPQYGCENIIKDIEAHYSYGAANAHYFLKDILMEHEKIHRTDFMNVVNDYKYVLDDLLLSNLEECEFFNSKEEAMTFWETKINEIYTSWHTLVVGMFNDKTGGWLWSDPLKRFSYELLTQMLTQPYIFNVLDSARVYFHCN